MTPFAVTMVVFGSFAAGIVVGLALGEAFRIARSGHTVTMPLRNPRVRTVLLVLVLASLLVNATLGFLLILARAATENEARSRAAVTARLDEVVDCVVRYNAAQGNALEERDARNGGVTAASVRLWINLRTALASGDLGPQTLLAPIDVYIASLQESQRSRVENPYPPADLCLRANHAD